MRLFRAFRFLLVMVGYSLHMMWAGRALKARAYNSFVATRQRIAARKLIQGLRITTEVKGSVPEDLATLISPNHIGALDPWIVASHFDVAFVAKAEMGTWPVIKTVTKAVAIIFAHRKNVMKTAETLNEIQERMRSGVSVLVFPEGTTSGGNDVRRHRSSSIQNYGLSSHCRDGRRLCHSSLLPCSQNQWGNGRYQFAKDGYVAQWSGHVRKYLGPA